MPRRNDIKKVMIIGSGPILIVHNIHNYIGRRGGRRQGHSCLSKR